MFFQVFAFVSRFLMRRLLTKRAVLWMLGALGILLLSSTCLIFLFERSANGTVKTLFQSFWLSVITFSTVGYGDFSPVTVGGRVTVIVLISGGIGFFATASGMLVAVVTSLFSRAESGLLPLEHLSCHAILIHPAPAAEQMGEELLADESAVRDIVVVTTEDRPSYVKGDHWYYYNGNPNAVEVLTAVNIRRADFVVIFPLESTDSQSADEHSFMVTATVKELNPECWVDVFIRVESNRPRFEKLGVKVVNAQLHAATLVAHDRLNGGLLEVANVLFSSRKPPQGYRVKIPREFVGEKVMVYYLRKKQTVVSLIRDGEITINPDPEQTLREGDELHIIASARP